jgi:hypothetical protein
MEVKELNGISEATGESYELVEDVPFMDDVKPKKGGTNAK